MKHDRRTFFGMLMAPFVAKAVPAKRGEFEYLGELCAAEPLLKSAQVNVNQLSTTDFPPYHPNCGCVIEIKCDASQAIAEMEKLIKAAERYNATLHERRRLDAAGPAKLGNNGDQLG